MDIETWLPLAAQNPDWWQVLITILAGVAAVCAFLSERTAVRVTQRADLLVDTVTMVPRQPPFMLRPETIIEVQVKNFGPTRANNVVIERLELSIAGVGSSPPGHEIPPAIIAAGDYMTPTFPQLGQNFSDEALRTATRGDAAFIVTVVVTYDDVFNRSHRTMQVARYDGGVGAFLMVENQAD